MNPAVRILQILGICAAVVPAGDQLLIAAVMWFGNQMSEGELTGQTCGQVLIALSSDLVIDRDLIESCDVNVVPDTVAKYISSGPMADAAYGTGMYLESWVGKDSPIGTMNIAAVQIKGRRAWVCRDHYCLFHAQI